MSVLLPGPDEVRAIVVGIERYPSLGEGFDTAGAAAGAIGFAAWLIEKRGVLARNVELWLLPVPGLDVDKMCKSTGIGGINIRSFDWTTFRSVMESPQGVFTTGSFLIVYYCGHGVVDGPESQQYLVLPAATHTQFRCFGIDNWRELFKTANWYRFAQQLWIIDACRNQWGDVMKPEQDKWTVRDPQSVQQCVMFSCAAGETASIDRGNGPRFTRELLSILLKVPRESWPPFALVFEETAERVRADPLSQQNPTLCIGFDWHGRPIQGTVAMEIPLSKVLSGLAWPLERLMPYIKGAWGTSLNVFAPPGSLQEAIESLHGLPLVRGVAPLIDFAARVARASDNEEIRAWVEARLTPQLRSELEQRLDSAPVCVRLQLWYRNDTLQACIESTVEVIDSNGKVLPAVRLPARPVEEGTELETLGQCIQAVYDHWSNQKLDLILELFLSKELLVSAAYDIATVPIANGDTWQLGRHAPVLLRCSDRFKGNARISRWLTNAPAILKRLSANIVQPVHWVAANEVAEDWEDVLISNDAKAPVWLGFHPEAETGLTPLDAVLANGLPAAVWLRTPETPDGNGPLIQQLQRLLQCSLDQVPSKITEMRRLKKTDPIRSAAVLLDDPASLPSMLTSWTQPEGYTG